MDESLRVPVDGVDLYVEASGPVGGPPVVLLHGFPECAHGWHRQAPALAAAGFRVLVPDQRGYRWSGKPAGTSAYALDRLADDVVAIVDAVDGTAAPFTVVGHDWGGLVAWWTAVRHPARVARLAVLNAPHPAAFGAYAREHASQRRRSWYVGFFQVPWLPETLLAAGDGALLARSLVRSSRRGTFSARDLAIYREAWRQPGAVRSMVNWYRALVRHRPPTRIAVRVGCPTRILWGERDAFLETGLAYASTTLCERATVRTFPRATHWLQHEEPDAVNAELLAFLRASGGEGGDETAARA